MPNVTVIRPCKGLEPYLYDCLASTFRQDYPYDRLTVHFCVSSRDDPAYPITQRVLKDFPEPKAKLFVEDEDLLLSADAQSPGEIEARQEVVDNVGRGRLGPNPKIRNMSRAYREAGRDDVIWILDCNIWAGRGACSRMVDKLCGFDHASGEGYRLVHHVPVSVAVDGRPDAFPTDTELISSQTRLNGQVKTPSTRTPDHKAPWYNPAVLGSRLEEVFLSSSHAKMYIAINTLGVAPCINGKSNMFRRAHLDYLTSSPSVPATAKGSAASRIDVDGDPNSQNVDSVRVHGIDAFSRYICEDHLIGELFWGHHIPGAEGMGNHGLVLGDLALQPVARMSLTGYIARRGRWLRVRKFTVTLATLVEPATESLLCSALGGFGVASCLAGDYVSLFGVEWWTIFFMFWLTSVVVWASIDRSVYCLLHSGATVEEDGSVNVPDFVLSQRTAQPRSRRDNDIRPFYEWLLAWAGREILALPIWAWAFWCGTTVVWRSRRFRVGMDMRVHEVEGRRG